MVAAGRTGELANVGWIARLRKRDGREPQGQRLPLRFAFPAKWKCSDDGRAQRLVEIVRNFSTERNCPGTVEKAPAKIDFVYRQSLGRLGHRGRGKLDVADAIPGGERRCFKNRFVRQKFHGNAGQIGEANFSMGKAIDPALREPDEIDGRGLTAEG